jgi:hypothetical protein
MRLVKPLAPPDSLHLKAAEASHSGARVGPVEPADPAALARAGFASE